MTTGLTYSDYVTQIATLAVVSPTDANFLIILPQATTYAENRIYRDLDLLSTVMTDASLALTVGTRLLSIPISKFVTLQQINVITPYPTTLPDLGTRNPLLPATKEWIDNVYPNNSVTGIPQYFGMLNQNSVVLGPWPDSPYQVELVGTFRPDSLSATNTQTALSLYWPDLLIMASMIYVSGYQRNFGRANDDPQMAVTYESTYQSLLKSAGVEEYRKKFQSAAWSSMEPAPVATPTRG